MATLLGLIAAVAVLAVTIACDPSGPASGQSPNSPSVSRAPIVRGAAFVALGDSYSAGAGLLPLEADSPLFCARSSLDFAHVVAQRRGLRLTDVSCSGANTTDVLTHAQFYGVGPQLDAIDPVHPPALVTVMIGGNDNDTFSDALRKCGAAAAADPTGSPCRDRYGTSFVDPVRRKTGPAVHAVLAAVHRKAPHATVVAVDYPWLLPATGGCYPRVMAAAGDIAYLRDLQTTLNGVIRTAAADTGSRFVDMSVVSEGRDACAAPDHRWIEPELDATTKVPMHPNALGERAIADQVLHTLN